MQDLTLRHAEICFSTMVTMAILDIGDWKAAQAAARRHLVRFLLDLPDTRRDMLVHRLGIEPRTFYAWAAAVEKEERETGETSAEKREETRQLTEQMRFFTAAMLHLQGARGEFLTLGNVTDHVNEELEENYPVRQVQERLDVYVQLGHLEHHPRNREKYRATVGNAKFRLEDLPIQEEILRKFYSSMHSIGLQVLAQAPGSMAGVVHFSIPEGQEEKVAQVLITGWERMKKEMEELEAQLLEEFPSTPRTVLTTLFAFGRDVRAKRLLEKEKENGKRQV